ncbi:MAG TPA: HAMP domain-containing sensor histidine kinase [Solirubrobacteraceae bacterium]
MGKRARPRRGAFGLQGRIVGAVLLTTVATLAVAALALLGPLEQSLRNAEKRTLESEVGNTRAQVERTTGPFTRLDLGLLSQATVKPAVAAGSGSGAATGGAAIGPNSGVNGKEEQTIAKQGQLVLQRAHRAVSSLQFTTGAAEVALLGYPESSGQNAKPVVASSDSGSAKYDPYDDAPQAFRTGRRNFSFGSIGGTEYVRVAIPFTTRGQHWVLVVRKSLDTLSDAVATVRRAFIYAALAGLALTLILGIPLSATIVRRLRRLREAATQLAHDGPPVVVPAVRARDEVGDLARSFEQMQQRLQQQEEARRAFVSTASHELRTPLASLDGMLELLDDDLGSGEVDIDDARSLLDRARAQARRLSRLAADLLDLSRLDAQVQLRSEPVELGELSRAVLAEFELGTEERGIVSTLDDAGGQVWALGDPGGIARIVRILLDNAVRVSPQGGEVTVELRNGTHASLTVRDEGPGVMDEESEMIFERFQRGRATGGSAGFGLGLAIGRELAERMGGELVLQRVATPGAKFTLRLPVAQAQQEEPVAVA